ncbi:MAG TPA: cysteine--tRNA ligase [Candidatus Nanoarchaeia archaeon]|nr:cysteine--tRNA ligase [Candidatus Nanoarchaeia archaeon]
MALKLYNTLTRKKELIKPMKDKEIKFYSCGPTVYNYAHIGNFRAYMCSDVLKRYLKYSSYKVSHIMNITDVDDKTIKGANSEGISLKEYTARYEKAFFENLESLNIDKADKFTRATDNIDEMVKIIKKLLDKKIAYKSEDGSIYYDISKFKGYGKLSHTKVEDLKEGARVKQDSYEKGEAKDFALWKAYDREDGNVFWETEIGKGRPGWHIECSAMSMKYLGGHFDIHAGGIDLVFPHHENEIAQSEAFSGKKFVNYWFHNEHLLLNGKKMSKSLGNFFTLRDLLNKGYNPIAIRYLLLSANYRVQLNFTEEAVKSSENAVQRLNDFMVKLKEIKNNNENKNIKKLIDKTKKSFDKSMDDDLNISGALAVVFDFVKEINTLMMENKIGKNNSTEIINLMNDFDSVLGVLQEKEGKLSHELKKLIDEREKARKEKDFAKADKLRNELKEKGIILEDTKEGVRWKKI